jgi:DNA ligase (NAD+)
VQTARSLAQAMKSLDEISAATVEELSAIPDIGQKTAEAIRDWFALPQSQHLISELKKAGVRTSESEQVEEEASTKRFEGLTFVLTGTLPTLSRNEAKALIEKEAGRVTGSVSSKTNYLLLGEDPGSKYERAVSLNVPVISEADLLAMLEENEGSV